MDQRYIVFSHRTTLKISTQLTNEEYRVAIAKANKMRLEDVPPFDSQAILAMIKKRSERIKKIAAGFKALLDSNPKTTKDKHEEHR